jgi:alkanesulfonate monooxygenase SsuD/methylene tetrahydromethanopterin reductase-like flavin-dependent oxidoreductase (luciferase family)
VAEGHGGDQFAVLGACAVATHRIRLGTSISSVFVRSARRSAWLRPPWDQLANGRFILGLGGSHRVQVEPEHGIPFVQPTARLRDTIAIVRALVQDGLVSHRGEVITIERFDLWFRPLRPQIPIYVAALFPRMLEIAGQLADGVLLTWPTTGTVARAVEHVAIGARQAGRAATAVDVASLIPCAVRRRRPPRVMPCALRSGSTPASFRVTTDCWQRRGFSDAVRDIKEALTAAAANRSSSSR